MIIKRKADIDSFLEEFSTFSEWDGVKNYLSVPYKKMNGMITLLQYEDGTFTIYRKNECFWDIREVPLNFEEVKDLIWKNRRIFNEYLKKLS